MPRSPNRASVRHIHTLFNVGTVGGLTDGELLAIFRGRPGEAAESAFAVIVERHGPMVHRVCRQVLGNPHDADDALQATFLILIHKASLLTLSDSLGPWLHGVALRVASCARSAKALRVAHERRAAEQRMPYAADSKWDDLGIVLHEEIHRLPERYRTAVVLCWLEGLSTEAAGRRLRCPQGTILSRLSRARTRLRKRLARRGATLAGGVLGTAYFAHAASAAMTEALIDSTLNTANQIISRNGAGVVSTEVATLTRKVLANMFLTKIKMTAAMLLSFGIMMAGAAVLARQESARSGNARAQSPSDGTVKRVDPSPEPEATSKGGSAVPSQPASDVGGKRDQPTPTDQASLRSGGYIFTASPTGNKAIAYDPTTRAVKAVQLNATKEHPLRITPWSSHAGFNRVVTLRLEGSRITRVAVFDLKSDKWVPIDLAEPVSGVVEAEAVGNGNTAYDLGRHIYTYSAKTGTWDHLDIRTISDDFDDHDAAKASASGKTVK